MLDSLPQRQHAHRDDVDWDDHARTGVRVPGEEYALTTATAPRRVDVPAALLDNDWNNHQPQQHPIGAAPPPTPPALPGQVGYTNPWHTP